MRYVIAIVATLGMVFGTGASDAGCDSSNQGPKERPVITGKKYIPKRTVHTLRCNGTKCVPAYTTKKACYQLILKQSNGKIKKVCVSKMTYDGKQVGDRHG